jgi:hypothetical protein
MSPTSVRSSSPAPDRCSHISRCDRRDSALCAPCGRGERSTAETLLQDRVELLAELLRRVPSTRQRDQAGVRTDGEFPACGIEDSVVAAGSTTVSDLTRSGASAAASTHRAVGMCHQVSRSSRQQGLHILGVFAEILAFHCGVRWVTASFQHLNLPPGAQRPLRTPRAAPADDRSVDEQDSFAIAGSLNEGTVSPDPTVRSPSRPSREASQSVGVMAIPMPWDITRERRRNRTCMTSLEG